MEAVVHQHANPGDQLALSHMGSVCSLVGDGDDDGDDYVCVFVCVLCVSSFHAQPQAIMAVPLGWPQAGPGQPACTAAPCTGMGRRQQSGFS